MTVVSRGQVAEYLSTWKDRGNVVVSKLRSAVKLVTPSPLRRFAREYLSRRWDAKYEGRPVEEIFSAIYREGKWGTTSDGDLSSGSGSRSPNVVLSYVNAVRTFLE